MYTYFLVSDNTEPVVCKLDKYEDIVMELKRRAKEAKELRKLIKPMKELHIGANIASHDFESKLGKAKELLADGHQVKIVVAIKQSRSKNIAPETVDETVLKILDGLEHHVQSIQQLESNVSTRRDLIVSPKLKVDTEIK